MRRRLILRTIRGQLGARLVVTALLPLLVFGGIIYTMERRSLRASADAKLEAVRSIKVQRIDAWLDKARGNALFLARLTGRMTRLAGGSIHDPHVGADLNLLFPSFLETHRQLRSISLANASTGEILIGSGRAGGGRDLGEVFGLPVPLETRSGGFQPVRLAAGDGAQQLLFVAPVRVGAESRGSPSWVLVVEMAWGQLDKLLLDRTGMGKTGETLLVNRDGLALNDLRRQRNATLRLKITAEPVVRALALERGVVETRDYRGIEVLAAYAPIPSTGWGFVAQQDAAEVFGPIDGLLKALLGALIAGAALALVIATFLARLYARPLVAIKEAASAIQEGDLSVRIPETGDDEIGELSDAVNAMARGLSRRVAVQTGAASVGTAAVTTLKSGQFARAVLTVFMEETGSQLGAFYAVDARTGLLAPVASLGVSAGALEAFDPDSFEGAFGAALATGEPVHLGVIPEDTPFTFKTFAGSAVPREMLSIPIVVRGKAEAVLALACLNEYPSHVPEMMELAVVMLNGSFGNVLAMEETQRLADELAGKNTELEAQAEELRAQRRELERQSDELSAQNVELEAQTVRLAEADRLKGEFLSNMSHELRTPLNSILALTQVLRSQGADRLSAEEGGYLEIIERNGRQLLALINDILDLAKIESGSVEIVAEDFSPAEEVAAVVESIAPLAREKEIEIRTEIAEGLGTMISDRKRVRQILLNLVGNAVKFTGEGRVVVAADRRRETVVVTIADTGIGIPAELLPHIFEEFRQVDGTTSREYEGTGLGLAIAAKSARILGGGIEVESTPGEGSRFTVTLPLDVGSSPGVGVPFSAGSSRAGNPVEVGRHVLLVEDSEAARIQVRYALDQAGLVVETAGSGPEALEAMRNNPPGCIILDLMMPGMDGFEVLEALRSTPETKETPVLVLTAKELTREDRAKLSANHIHTLIQKGDVSKEELIARVLDILSLPPSARKKAENADDE